ncbi:MAG: hypothetical protein JWO13_257 [Acidobacteriales bacterium]|nr:hypothetical protein [Terriglobales bacterium]
MARKMGQLAYRFFLIVPLLSLQGCSVTSDRLLVGTYKAEATCETITLKMNRNHSFVQSVVTSNGEISHLEGTWSVDNEFKTVEFTPFLDFLKDGRGTHVGGMSSPAELLPNGVHMGPIIVRCGPKVSHELDYVK